MFYHFSASVGAGKTKAVFDYIRDNLDIGYIFVCPTVDLCEEAYARLLQTLVDRPHYSNSDLVSLITQDASRGPVFARALAACRAYNRATPPILIVTRPTLLFLCETLLDHEKSMFDVFIDEGMTPIEQAQFSPSNMQVFLQRLAIGRDGLAQAAPGQTEILEMVAHNPEALNSRQLGELNVPAFQDICSWVVSTNYDAFVLPTDKAIQALGVLSPQKLSTFRNVIMIVAVFEATLLPRLWEGLHGIRFAPWPHTQGIFDTHRVKGPSILIHYMLHPDDFPSKRNLNRNSESYESNEVAASNRVIHRLAEEVNSMFDSGNYCWSANKDFRNEGDVLEGTRMPPVCAGMDRFRHFDNVVSFLAINPHPWVQRAITTIFDLESNEIYESWRFGYTYQTVGRCSLRNRDSTRPITMVVLSRRCAERLADLFEGSTIVGQCTSVGRLSTGSAAGRPAAVHQGRRSTKADNSAFSKYVKRSRSKGHIPLEKENWFEQIRLPQLRTQG